MYKKVGQRMQSRVEVGSPIPRRLNGLAVEKDVNKWRKYIRESNLFDHGIWDIRPGSRDETAVETPKTVANERDKGGSPVCTHGEDGVRTPTNMVDCLMKRDELEWLAAWDDDGRASEKLREDSGLIPAQPAGDLSEEAPDTESYDDADKDNGGGKAGFIGDGRGHNIQSQTDAQEHEDHHRSWAKQETDAKEHEDMGEG